MTQQRQHEPFTLFNVRIVDMRHLWHPSDTYKGQQQKPNYFAGFIVPKTTAHWSTEPALAGLVQALGKLYQSNPQIVDWRIEDGDTPNAEGKSSDFAKGNWLFNASSSNLPNVELVQAGGALTKLANKVGVKSGDYCMVGGTAVVSGQNNRAAKLYLNAVVFSAPGEEIVFANSVSGAELMQQAQRQGLQVAGFHGSAPSGFGAPAQPFGAPGGFAPNAHPPGSFAPQGPSYQAQPHFGGAPTPAFAAPQPGFAPGVAPNAQTGGYAAPGTAPNGPAFGGNAASPFSGQSFATPQTNNPFGQR